MKKTAQETITEDFNLFRVIEIVIKRKIAVFIITLVCFSIGFVYEINNKIENNNVISLSIELASNWEKDFVKKLKYLVLYDSLENEKKTETDVQINNLDLSLKEYTTYSYYDLKKYQESIINIGSKNLYVQFGELLNNQISLNKIIIDSPEYQKFSQNQQFEINQFIHSLKIIVSENTVDNFDKIVLEFVNAKDELKASQQNIDFIINKVTEHIKTRLILQLNILLSSYISNLEKDFYNNVQMNQEIYNDLMFRLKTHLDIAKKLNIKRNTDVIINEFSTSYYLKGYELIEQEIYILDKEIKRNNNFNFDTRLDNVFVKYLKNDINIMKKSSNEFEIIRYDYSQYKISTLPRSAGILILSFIVGFILSILFTLTLENYYIYKKNKY
jgi:LPS O-antigen subunit length determinant protein (WzzB/FepE family)